MQCSFLFYRKANSAHASNSDVTILKPLNPDALANVNTPQEMERVKGMMEKPGL
jgi:hypothetical protein